jgi:hypothetical protein
MVQVQQNLTNVFISPRQKEGIDYANDPSKFNPIATLRDIEEGVIKVLSHGEVNQNVISRELAPSYPIPKGAVVSMSGSGVLQLCDCLDASTMPAYGISMQHIEPFNRGPVLLSGTLENSEWALSPRAILFVLRNGAFGTPFPTSGYLQKLGYVLTSTKILVDLDIYIKRA